MKILLVNPEFPETYWSFRHALPFEGKRCVFPPLGLMTVSSLLPSSCERRLVDLNVERLKDSQIEWADMVFITGMLAQKESLHEVSQALQSNAANESCSADRMSPAPSKNCRTPITSFRVKPKQRLPHSSTISNAAKRNASTKRRNGRRCRSRRSPDFGLVNLKKYSCMSVQYSRGCPFSCEFCDIIEIYGRVPRTKSNQQMLAEFDALKQSRLAGTTLHRRRQLHRQQEERASTSARLGRVAKEETDFHFHC